MVRSFVDVSLRYCLLAAFLLTALAICFIYVLPVLIRKLVTYGIIGTLFTFSLLTTNSIPIAFLENDVEILVKDLVLLY